MWAATNKALRRAVRYASRGLVIVAVVYFGYEISRQWEDVADYSPSSGEIGLLVACLIYYGLSLFLLAEAWHRITSLVATVPTERRLTVPSFAITQLAKYVPGNVFHFVWRHAWLADAGIPHHRLLLALALETAVLAVTSVIAASLMYVMSPLPGDIWVTPILNIAAPTIALIFGALCVVGFLWAVLLPRRSNLRMKLVNCLVASCACVVFFVSLGFVLLLVVGTTAHGSPTLVVVTAAIISWTIGFLTPGAPGGTGIREIVLLFLLTPHMAKAEVLMAIVLFRLVTTGGDFVCYGAGVLIAKCNGPHSKCGGTAMDAVSGPD